MKKVFLIAPLFFAITLSGSASALEHEAIGEDPGNGVAEAPANLSLSLTEEERQARLQKIAQQLREVEEEALRLSLLVTKMVLEEQVLALEEQVSALEQKLLAQESMEEGEDAEEQVALIEESAEELVVAGSQADEGLGEEEEPSDKTPAAAEALASSQDEQEQRGFLAGLGPIGNLETPELAALAILVLLAVFIVRRQLRERAGRKRAPLQPQSPPGAQAFQSSSEGAQGTLDESRQDLKERVVWR